MARFLSLFLGAVIAMAGCGGSGAATIAGTGTTDGTGDTRPSDDDDAPPTHGVTAVSGGRPGATGENRCRRAGLKWVRGTEDHDLLIGGPKPEAFGALGGNDLTRTGASRNCTILSAGDDLGIGGRGDDYIDGGDGDDALHPAAGDDDVVGSLGKDFLGGSPGDDEAWGGGGKDVVEGGPGRDLVVGDLASDVLDGGLGNDRLKSADGFSDVVDCGRGNDRVVADRKDRISGCEHRSFVQRQRRGRGHAQKEKAERAKLHERAQEG